jgi:hypothetical protein
MRPLKLTAYDDDYPTCQQTYAVLRIFSDSTSPREATALLGITPTDSFEKGEAVGTRGAKRRQNGWFLSTEAQVQSRDSRRHLDWLVAAICDREEALSRLRSAGAEIDVSCYWVSLGQGGPVIGPEQMKQLSRLGLEVWWDVYFDTSAAEPMTQAPAAISG